MTTATIDKQKPASQKAITSTKAKVHNRLRRAEGQLRGLQKMVDEERPCREILALLAGVRSAVDAAGDLILQTYLEECQTDFSQGQGDAQGLVEVIRLLRR